jgi:hypothetical protein
LLDWKDNDDVADGVGTSSVLGFVARPENFLVEVKPRVSDAVKRIVITINLQTDDIDIIETHLSIVCTVIFSIYERNEDNNNTVRSLLDRLRVESYE